MSASILPRIADQRRLHALRGCVNQVGVDVLLELRDGLKDIVAESVLSEESTVQAQGAYLALKELLTLIEPPSGS